MTVFNFNATKDQVPKQSGLVNCFISPRKSDSGPLFWELDGAVGFFLDGYAIIPIEEYYRLNGGSGFTE